MFAKTMLAILPLLLTSLTTTNALVVPDTSGLLFRRDTCADTCGSTCYWASDITAAVKKGYQLYEAGTTIGKDSYPHAYHDDEGFSFSVSGPYYEFPILSSYKVYSGGSPGADRVIFNKAGDLAGLITHTGSSQYDGFVQCSADSSDDLGTDPDYF